MRKIIGAFVAATLVVALAIVAGTLYFNSPDLGALRQTTELSAHLNEDALPEASNDIEIPFHIIARHREDNNLADLQWIVEQLKGERGREIESLAFQVSLKDLKQDLVKQYGVEQGALLFEQIIREALPEHATAILANVDLIQEYDRWLVENFISLGELAPADQQLELWKKRRELFGDAAEEIWDDEQNIIEERRVAVNTALSVLDTAYDMPMEDKASFLKNTYDGNYLGTLEDLVSDSRSLLSQVFFGLDSVQEELAAMDDEQRQSKMAEMRKTFGFDDAAVEEMAALDQKLDARWDNGLAYMTERASLKTDDPIEREQQIDALRQKYFAEESTTIKREEEDLGLFRYDRPRVFGRN